MRTNDPIGRMFKRGELRRATEHDRKAADARLKAARMWQSIKKPVPVLGTGHRFARRFTPVEVNTLPRR
jgi:hypothetical protein